MSKEVMTIHDVAEFLSLSERTVQRYIKEKIIPASKIGKCWRITHADLMTAIEKAKADA